MFLCSLLTFAQFSGSGSGTENDPYLILNPIQLNQIRNFLNKKGVYFKLMADIDLEEFIEDEYPSQGWLPIGDVNSSRFSGIFDGNGKTISNIIIDRESSDMVGLFGSCINATIKNLTLNGTVKGNNYVGLLCGDGFDLSISNCIVNGTIEGNSYVGGCIGRNIGPITDISSSVSVTGKGDYVGGIVGYTNFQVNNCMVKGEISGQDHVGGIGGTTGVGIAPFNNCIVQANISGRDNIGGICGNYEKAVKMFINNSRFFGNIKGNANVGGICGFGMCDGCCAIGSVKAYNNNCGGLAGHGFVNNSYYCGTVEGHYYVGGVIGDGYSNRSYANANVYGTQYVGGLCGKTSYGWNSWDASTYNSLAIATYIKASEGDVGRIFGTSEKSPSVSANKAYNRIVVISKGVVQDIIDDNENGTGVSATTLKLKATYVAMGWDFTDTWEILETESYPYFKTQTAPPVITSKVISGATTISGKCVDGGTITLEIDGVKQQQISSGHEFSFNVSPLQAGHEVRISAKAEGKEQSYYTTETVQYLGSGKENDPYQVYTASDLTGVYRKGYFKLMNDIDLTDYINQFSPAEGWQSIGREGSETIHFDGNGHKITGLWCNSTRDNTGLFSCFANGTIKNLIVETAKSKQVKGGANTGILIGKMINGTIENCRVSGTVADGTPVGGMVGLFDGGKISLSQANVTINTTGEKSYVGGLVGEITSGEIDQCVTLGTVTATGKESYAGGLVGKNSANVTNCYSNANVTSSYNAAGLIAYNYGIVDKCYATGNLASSNYGAGVIGYNDGANAVIKNSAAMNNKIDVTYESLSAQSGGYGQRIIGGLKNGAPAPELDNYALKTMQVSVNNVPQKVYDDIMNGVSKNGSDLVKASTYQELGWNFSNIWTITEGESYPSLKNNAANVLKPGEDSEPEPAPTSEENMTVATVNASTGKTATMGINLDNKATDLTAFQFDLKLPAGFTLSKDSKDKFQVTKTSRYKDDNQQLTVSLQEDGSYRFISFSMSNGVIDGTSGAILNAILSVGANVTAGTYEGSISNIIFTKVDGTQLKLSDTKFNIVINNTILGDANGDGEVNVADIVEIVNYILGKPSTKFVKAAADVSKDGDVNVTDIVMVVNIIMSVQNSSARNRSGKIESSTDNDLLSLTEVGNGSLSLSLENRGDYVASQFDVRLSEGQTLESITLNGQRSGGHLMTYAKTGNNIYKVIVYSLSNERFAGNSGELLNIRVSDAGSVDIENILFVTSGQNENQFEPLHSYTTNINKVEKAEDDLHIYTIDGRLVRKQVNNTNGLIKGVYIINGKKMIKNK